MNIAALGLNFGAIAPALILVSAAIVVLVVDAFSGDEDPTPLAYLGLLAMAISGVAAIMLARAPVAGFAGMVRHDALASFGELIAIVSGAFTLLAARRDMTNHRMRKGEFFALLLVATSGMAFMVSASDLVMLFLGLELMSIPVYVLAGFDRSSERSAEAAMKYFILGSFATGLLLYGSALLYGATGGTSYQAIAQKVTAGLFKTDLYFSLGATLVLAAMAFKVSAVPFHMWTPDVYEGAPASITAYMGAAVKATAFIALARLLTVVLGPASDWVYPVLWGLAALTMLAGNVLALVQRNIKRMLAYSSVAHAGYLLVALTAGSSGGSSALLFYLLVYALANVGAFLVLIAVSAGRDAEDLDAWSSLGYKRPLLGLAMTICLLSLAGIPPTAGFFGKFYIFKEAIDRGLLHLALIGMVGSAIGVYYYLRVIVVMYMQEGSAGMQLPTRDANLSVAIAVAATATLVLGLLPQRLLEIAQKSIEGLL